MNILEKKNCFLLKKTERIPPYDFLNWDIKKELLTCDIWSINTLTIIIVGYMTHSNVKILKHEWLI